MSVYLSPQALADSAGAHAERSYELWRAWAAEHELEATEERLRAEGACAAPPPLPLAEVLGRWVVVAVLFGMGSIALYFHIVSLFAVHGA